MNYRSFLIALFTIMAVALVGIACGGDDDGTPDGGSTTATPGLATTPAASVEYCNEQAVNDAVDLYVNSVTQSLTEEPTLQLDDVEGMRRDIESALRTLCEAGANPPLEAISTYCDGVVAAIDLRLTGPTEDRNRFLTEYYNSCNAAD
jgi:hypothetical protein